MKNKLICVFSLLLLLQPSITWACEACQIQQPKVTRGITHGTGPESNWDWFLIGIIILITVLTLFYSIKYLVKPGEKNKDHIKYSFLSD